MYYRWFAKCPSGICGGSYVVDQQLYRTIANLRSGSDIYIGINPALRADRIKVSDCDIGSIQNILVDVDPVGPNTAPLDFALPAIVRTIGSLLESRPGIRCIDSGRGIQLWLAVTPTAPSTIVPRNWRQAVGTFLRRLDAALDAGARGFHIDTACTDLSRLARCPGTINHRTNRPTVDFGWMTGEPIQPNAFLAKFAEPDAAMLHPNGQTFDVWWKAFSYLTVSARRFITEGVKSGERNDAAYKTAAALRAAGIPVTQTRYALQQGNKLCVPEPLATQELERILHNAYK